MGTRNVRFDVAARFLPIFVAKRNTSRLFVLMSIFAALGQYLSLSARAEPPYQTVWSRQFGTSNDDVDGSAFAVDSSGNAYMTGYTQGSL